MSSILEFISRFVDEKLSAARVVICLLLLTLVTNGSLLLAQYGPSSGFDVPMPAFDDTSAPEESGKPVPNGGAIAGVRPPAPLPSPSGVERSSDVKGASAVLAAGVVGGAQNGDSGTTAPDPQLGSASSASSLGLPNVLWDLVPN